LVCYIAPTYFIVDEDLHFLLDYDSGCGQMGWWWWPSRRLYLQDLYDHLRLNRGIFLRATVSLVLGGAFILKAVLGYGRSTFS